MMMKRVTASLTIEAAMVLPIFLFMMIGFLSFVQIFIIQDKVQGSITEMGLKLSKYGYFYGSYVEDIVEEDDDEIGTLMRDILGDKLEEVSLKIHLSQYMNLTKLQENMIVGGFSGISMKDSSWMDDEDCIDLIVSYQVELPFGYPIIHQIPMVQRVRLRGWTGHQIPAKYIEQEDAEGENTTVYMTSSGTVYHTSSSCTYIKIEVKETQGVPKEERNESGGRYYPCNTCCKGLDNENITYYISKYGDRYHSKRNCSKIYRNIKEVKQSEVSHLRICSKCDSGKSN